MRTPSSNLKDYDLHIYLTKRKNYCYIVHLAYSDSSLLPTQKEYSSDRDFKVSQTHS